MSLNNNTSSSVVPTSSPVSDVVSPSPDAPHIDRAMSRALLHKHHNRDKQIIKKINKLQAEKKAFYSFEYFPPKVSVLHPYLFLALHLYSS